MNTTSNHRWLVLAKVLAVFGLLGFSDPLRAAPGDLDPTFGTGGIVRTHVVPANLTCNCNNSARAVAIQPDGKIVAAGGTTSISASAIFHGDFAVVRYNPDGSLDQSFGVGGMVITDIDNVSQDEGRAVAIQNDGKIIVGGNATLTNSSSRFALVRYNTDGSLDMNFGTGGKVIESFGSYFSGLNGLVAQTDGKLVVAGESRSQLGKNDFALARFNTDGSLDASFGINGMVLTDIASDSYDIAYALALQADEKIVVAGSTSFAQNLPYGDFAVVRYNTDGSLDLSFGVSGRAITDFNGSTDQALAVTIQADGKLVVGGAAFTTGSTRQDFAIARYNSDGSLDASFGTGGKTTGNIFPSFSNHVVYAVAVEANGKIVFAGSAAVFSPVFAGQVPIFL